MLKRLLLVTLTLLVASCGFHLRGMMEAPSWLRGIAISAEALDVELVSMLKSQLKHYKIEVYPDITKAPYLLITQSRFEKRIISVGASTNPRQYQLLLTIELMLQSKNAEIIVPKRQLLVTRQLTVNNDRILGSNEEERILMNEMRQDALIQLCGILFSAKPTYHAN